MAHSPKPSPNTEIAKGVTPPRRGFLTEAAAVLIGGIVAVFPFAAGLIPFFDPLRRGSGGAKKLRVASLDAVPDDGVPRRFPVIADLVDAWTNYGKEPIGAVYLVRDKGSKKVRALNAICPHAGCMVAFEASKDLFQCPCHTSAFDVEGKRRLDISKVPPRDMDTLTCMVKDGEVWVEFMNFQTGHAEKTPKA
jgi:menaquinol-cytochrome c reductase iron-sulfur subunit